MDTHEDRAALAERARFQIGFYGSTRNYAFQFDDLGWEGPSARLNDRLKAGDLAGLGATVTEEMLETFVVVGRWDEIADLLIDRYADTATRVISYLTIDDLTRNPDHAGRGRRSRGQFEACHVPPPPSDAAVARRFRADLPGRICAPGRIRTCDLPLRRRALYPLSYEGGAGAAVL